MQDLEFSVPIPLEETRQRLLNLTNQAISQRGKIKVDEAQLDENTVQFRVWVYPNSPDIEVVGFLRRTADVQTFVAGEAKIGHFVYYQVIALLIFGVTILANTGIEALVILIPLLGIRIGWVWHKITSLREQLIAVVGSSLRWKPDVKDYSVVAKRN